MLEIFGFRVIILIFFLSRLVSSGNCITAIHEMPSLLDALRQRSAVDCDTLDSKGTYSI